MVSLIGTSRWLATSQPTGLSGSAVAAAVVVPIGGPAASRSRTARDGGGAARTVRRRPAGSAHRAAAAASSFSAGRPSPAGYGGLTSPTAGSTRSSSSDP